MGLLLIEVAEYPDFLLIGNWVKFVQHFMIDECGLSSCADENLLWEIRIGEDGHIDCLAVIGLPIPSSEGHAGFLVGLLEIVIHQCCHIMQLIRVAVGLNCYCYTKIISFLLYSLLFCGKSSLGLSTFK